MKVHQSTSRNRSAAGIGYSTKDRPKAPPATGTKIQRPARDWAAYNNELVDRPRKVMELVVDLATIGAWKVRSGRRGQPAYAAGAISACYMVRSQFHLTLRGTEGVMRSIFSRAGVDPDLVPDFSTLCKRRRAVRLHRPKHAGEVALVDGTGFSFRTPGAWIQHKWKGDQTANHRFVRVTLVTDAGTGAVLDVVVTPDAGEGTGELSQFGRLSATSAHLGAKTIIGDGLYDAKSSYESSREHGLRLLAPPHSNAVLGLHPDRDVTLVQIQRLGIREWKRRVGYHQRSRVEADIGAAKAVSGDQVRAHSFAGAVAEVTAALSVMNLWRLGSQELELAS
jgi:hypothetical protein